jgi:hypothetical protein
MRLNGSFPLVRTNSDQTIGLKNLLGLETGLAQFAVSPGSFVPGAMADSLTSYGGLLFEDSGGQTTLLAFLRAGATGSFGTVVEPCNFTGKFPDPIGYFYQARDFTLAFTITNLPPTPGNQIAMTVNGLALEYTVPQDATLQSVTAGLADLLNAQTAVTRTSPTPTD